MSIQIPLSIIRDNPWQTRQEYDQERIELLALDISRNSILQPPAGRVVDAEGHPVPESDYHNAESIAKGCVRLILDKGWSIQLAFGHSRLRACRHLGWETMPVEIRELTDEQMATLAWSENSQRKDLSPIEQAYAIRKMMQDFKWTQERVAAELGIDRSTVANKLRLLKLPEEVLEHLKAGTISERQAGALVPAFEIPEEDLALAPSWGWKPADLVRFATKGMSSDELRERVGYLKKSIDKEKTTRALQEQARLKRESEQAALPDDVEASPEPAETEDEYEPEECDLCGEPECDRTCTQAMIEDGAFDVATFGWPQPRIDPVWDELEKMTKVQLEKLHDSLRCPLWTRNASHFYSSAKKDEMIAYLRPLLQFRANLVAGCEMTDEQVDVFGQWLERLVSENRYHQPPKGVTYNGWLFAHELDTMRRESGLEGEAWQRYRLAHLRQAAGFCYHLFFEKMVEEAQRLADWELDEVHPEELQAFGDRSPWDEDPAPALMEDDVRRCRVCGCTDDDCSQCIERTGEPCSWVEWDLCSACHDAAIQYEDKLGIPDWPDSDVRAQTSVAEAARLRQRFKSATSWMGLANYHIVARQVIDDTLEDLEKIDGELATLETSEAVDALAVDVATIRELLLEDLERRERENTEIMMEAENG